MRQVSNLFAALVVHNCSSQLVLFSPPLGEALLQSADSDSWKQTASNVICCPHRMLTESALQNLFLAILMSRSVLGTLLCLSSFHHFVILVSPDFPTNVAAPIRDGPCNIDLVTKTSLKSTPKLASTC